MIIKSIYWISTGLICLLYLSSTVMYLWDLPSAQAQYASLEYPEYLALTMAFAKLAAVVAILSRVSVALSDLAYAGTLFHLMLAASAHINVGDGMWPPAVIAIGLLIISFLTQNTARKKPAPYGSLKALLGH